MSVGKTAECVAAIQAGDTAKLKQLLDEDPALANAMADDKRTMLHITTDWPGHFPNVAENIRLLIAHGADPSPEFRNAKHTETPLHGAASCDDVEAIDALLEGGANIEAAGAVIGGGTAMADAVAFACFRAARRLLERGAQTNLWQSAALGLKERVEAFFAASPEPGSDEITNAFWSACWGGQRAMAEWLLERGADLHWVGYDGMTPLDAAKRSGVSEMIEWLNAQIALRAARQR